MRHVFQTTLLAALVAAATPALALTWTAGSVTANGAADHTNSANYTLDVGNSSSISSGGITATVTAWSNSNQTGAVNEADVGSSSNSLAYTLESAYLAQYTGGYGVANRDITSSTATLGDANEGNSPEHAIDNNQRYDSVLFSFSGAANGVILNAVNKGWVSTDSDISVWAYTGGITTSSNLTGATYGNLGSGWTLVGHYAGGTSTGAVSINTTGISSSYWLIGAYTPVTTAPVDGCTSCGTNYLDYFKVSSVTGSAANCTTTPGAPGCLPPSNNVPEPATLGLLGLGLLGLAGMRRSA